jgi:hypothetical protein
MRKRINETWTGRGCLNLSTLPSFLPLPVFQVYEEHFYIYQYTKMTPDSYANVSHFRCLPMLTITTAQILKTPE